MAITSINGTPWANLANFNNIAKANIASIGGMSAPAASAEITFSDITNSCRTNFGWTSTNPLVVSLPATAGTGDLVFMSVSHDHINNDEKLATPTGWTKVMQAGDGIVDIWTYLFYKVLDGTEAGIVYVYYIGTSTGRDGFASAWLVEGVDTTNPIHASGSAATTTAASINCPSVDYTIDGRALAIMAYDGGDGEPFTISDNYVEMVNTQCDSSTTGMGMVIAYKDFTGTGATGTVTFTALASNSDGFATRQCFLKPA